MTNAAKETVALQRHGTEVTKVFWFFFSKKQRLA